MRTLFALLLIYFLTGLVQFAENNTFAKKDIRISSETDTTEIGCIALSEVGLSESLLQNLEDEDNKIFAFPLKNKTSPYSPEIVNRPNTGETSNIFKRIIILYTNLPPPGLFLNKHCFSEIA